MSTKLHREYNAIFSVDKNGKPRIWKASIFQFMETDHALSVVQHGTYGGKLQMEQREYTKGKNIGKKNETSPLEQCVSETEKRMRDKIEKENYSEQFPSSQPPAKQASESRSRKIFPMLANKYEPASNTKKKQGIVYPCFVQPKLDGLRCVVYMDTAPIYQSRTGGAFAVLQHLDSDILRLFERFPANTVFDGELYTDQIPFEELAGIIKKKTLTESDAVKIRSVKYHIYDIVEPGVPYHARLNTLQNIHECGSSHIVLVPTFAVPGVDQFKEKFGEFVEAGYEGIMLRNADGLYRENYRSNDLMKYKEFSESEYPIVDYKEATGRDSGTVIWECETPDGRRFHVRPRGTVEMRRRWFEGAKQYVGKQLTVIYQELSEMGVPRFPVGKAIRDGY